jgi:hypothetical protein
MVANAIKNRTCARHRLHGVQVVIVQLAGAAIVARVQGKGDKALIVIDKFHHTVPKIRTGVDIRKVNKLQGLERILKKAGASGRTLYDKWLKVAVQLQNVVGL